MTSNWDGSTSAGPGIQIGDVIADKYRITSLLGAGGMGAVFAARHTKLGGDFALKFLSSDAVATPQALERFAREARAAAKLRSEHAVQVFDVGTHTNGLPYIVMEHLDGHDLAALIRESGPLAIGEALDYVRQACSAIAAAHQAGVIHRDIKPSNLFQITRDGRRSLIKVLDFGISKLTDAALGEGGFTLTNNLVGSPSYMSPEQMRTPNRVDFRTDIWSLGVVLYECLTAKLPFPASTLPELCLRVAEEPPIPPRAHRPDLPLELEQLVLKCLEKDPGLRFQSVSELVNALRSLELATSPQRDFMLLEPTLQSGPPNGALTPTNPSWEHSAHPPSRGSRQLLMGVLALVAVAAVSVTAFVVHRGTLVTGDSNAASPQLDPSVLAPGASVSVASIPPPERAPQPSLRVELPAPSAPLTAKSASVVAPRLSRPTLPAPRTPTSHVVPSINPPPPPLAVERNTQTKTWKR